MEPTIDTDVSEDIPAEEPGEIVVDGAELNADESTYTVSIADFESVSAFITANATVGAENVRDKNFSKTGSLTAEKDAKVEVTLKAKSGAKITSVKNGETPIEPAEGVYTITIAALTADTSITVEAAAAYALTTDFGDSGVTAIVLDKSLKDAIGAENDGTAMEVTKASVAQGEDLKFTLKGEAAEDSKFIVSYKADGSGEATEIAAMEETVGETKVDTYTVSKDVLGDLHAIEICVAADAKIDLEALLGKVSNTDVDISYWGTKTEGTETKEDWATTDNGYTPIKKAYVGETFKFKATVKEAIKNKAITKVAMTVGGKEETLTGTEGVYSFTVKEDISAFTIVTDYVETATNKLTYTLKDICDKDSVTKVEITKITYGTTDVGNITDVLGGGKADAVLKAGEAVTVLQKSGEDAVAAIEVTVTPKNGYVVKKGDADAHITIDAGTGAATYKFTAEAGDDSKAISADMKVEVETEVKATAEGNEKFFMVTRDAGSEGSEKNTHVSDPVVTTVIGKVEAVPTSDSDTTVKAYKVLAGVQTVEFKVTADAGYKLQSVESYTGYKSVKEEPAAEGKVIYTVTLFAGAINGSDVDNPLSISVEEAAVLLSAEVKDASEESTGNYKTPEIKYFTKDNPENEQEYTSGETIPYGSKLTTTIQPADGCHLTSVSYSLGGSDTAMPVALNEDGEAEVVIAEATANVTITVAAAKDYEKTALTKASDYDGENPTQDEDGIYSVRYDGKYLVGLKNGGAEVPAKEFKAVVKDETGTEVKLPRITVGNSLKIDLTRAKTSLAGQLITIDMVVGDQVVDTYTLSVNKKSTKLTIEGAVKAQKEQRVDSRLGYVVETDGDINALDVDYYTDDAGSIIESAEMIGNKLFVTMKPMITADIIKTAATETAPAVYHSATITLTSDDDEDLEASLVVTAKPFIDDIANKEVTLTAGDQADTVLNVTLGMGDVEVPESGNLYYELTVTPKPVAGTTLSDKLLSAVTVEPIDKLGDSQKTQIVVAKSERLGEGAACDYEVKAKLTYHAGLKTESTKEVTSTDFATIDGKEIQYENNLKLTKDKSFKGTLYTGQSGEIVIANPTWSKKNVTYKILSGDIYDSEKYDADGEMLSTLEVGQNASGQIVVKNVPVDTYLGKHIITVEATADQTTGHEMYKSRATITVNVVKGIEEYGFSITAPSERIYKKDAKAKGTLKMAAQFEGTASWDGKKYVKLPKSKNLKWELVGAGSEEGNDYPLPESFANKAVTINEKNGTITVDKKFAISKNAANNRFCVKATAADYVGNTAVAYSETIEITDKALDIAKLALVKQVSGKYEVVAVQNNDKEEIAISATAAHGAKVYALPTGVELAGEYTVSQWNKLASKLIDPANYSVTSSGKKIAEVYGQTISVLAAGKKVKLTVAVNDGSKQKRTLPLNLGWAGAENDMALKISSVNTNGSYNNGDVFDPASEYAKQKDKAAIEVKDITATGAVRLNVQLMEGNKGDGSSASFTKADGFTNYKLAVKGGKFSSNVKGSALLVCNAKVTTLTLTIGSGKDAKKSVYTIKNKAYELTEKAPKVAVKGNLYESGHKSEQQVTMTVLNGKDLYGKKSVKVEVDWTSMNDKNREALFQIHNAMENRVIALDEKTGAMTLSFKALNNKGEEDDELRFTPGSYKLKVTVGTGTQESFKPETLPANVTLKVAKNKAFTFKPQTSYTIGKLDGGAILTGKSNVAKGEKTFMNFYDLQNANLNGRPNDFTHYFKIAYDGINGTYRLVLNADDPVFKEKFGITAQTPIDWNAIDLTKIEKKDLTGYVSYNARSNKKHYGVGTTGWNNSASGTVKITVKVVANPKNGVYKPSLKYTTNKAEVLAKDNEKAVINVMCGNEYVTVKHALFYITDQFTQAEINSKGQILLTVKGVEAKKTYSTTMKIVPLSSSFVSIIDAIDPAKDKEKYLEALEQYGIPVKVSVTAKATAEEVTVTPDPVTASAAVNLINDKTHGADSWTTKLSIAGDTTTEAEMTAAKNAIVTEVTNFLNTFDQYKDGFTVKANHISVRRNEAIVNLTVEKGSDVEYFTIRLALAAGGETPPTEEEPTVSKIEIAVKDNGTAEVTKGDETGLTLAVTLTYENDESPDEAPEITWSAKDGSNNEVTIDGTNIKLDTSNALAPVLTVKDDNSVTVTSLKLKATVGKEDNAVESNELEITIKNAQSSGS